MVMPVDIAATARTFHQEGKDADFGERMVGHHEDRLVRIGGQFVFKPFPLGVIDGAGCDPFVEARAFLERIEHDEVRPWRFHHEDEAFLHLGRRRVGGEGLREIGALVVVAHSQSEMDACSLQRDEDFLEARILRGLSGQISQVAQRNHIAGQGVELQDVRDRPFQTGRLIPLRVGVQVGNDTDPIVVKGRRRKSEAFFRSGRGQALRPFQIQQAALQPEEGQA